MEVQKCSTIFTTPPFCVALNTPSSCIYVLLVTLVVGATEVTLPTQFKKNQPAINIFPVHLLHGTGLFVIAPCTRGT